MELLFYRRKTEINSKFFFFCKFLIKFTQLVETDEIHGHIYSTPVCIFSGTLKKHSREIGKWLNKEN